MGNTENEDNTNKRGGCHITLQNALRKVYKLRRIRAGSSTLFLISFKN
jgi:hypothetical protein